MLNGGKTGKNKIQANIGVRSTNPLDPREVVDSPSLEVSKARLDGAWSNKGQWKVYLPMAGDGNDDLEGLHQTQTSGTGFVHTTVISITPEILHFQKQPPARGISLKLALHSTYFKNCLRLLLENIKAPVFLHC